MARDPVRVTRLVRLLRLLVHKGLCEGTGCTIRGLYHILRLTELDVTEDSVSSTLEEVVSVLSVPRCRLGIFSGEGHS